MIYFVFSHFQFLQRLLLWGKAEIPEHSVGIQLNGLDIFLIIGICFFIGLSVILFMKFWGVRKEKLNLEAKQADSLIFYSQIQFNNTEVQELNRTLEKCRLLAMEIDEITGRKNCSQNVAEIVYRISKYSDFDETTAQLHYCAALVYDVGFLKIDKKILQLPEISKEQFNLIQTHTSLAKEFLDFVPDRWSLLFLDAAEKHHENIDGTGYPYHLKAKEIPYIARVIRVAESYEAMVSPREYRKIMDHEMALEYLISQNSLFDKKILEVMNEVI